MGIAGLGLALIIAGLLIWRRNQFEYDDWEEELEYVSPDDIMDAIIALDDQYKTGGLPKGAYQHRREELKTELKNVLNREP